jgi:hypothetical protein
MHVNRSLGAHTLALFGLPNARLASAAPHGAATRLDQKPEAQTTLRSDQPRDVSKPLTDAQINSPEFAEFKARMELFTDSARRAMLTEAAEERQAVKEKFREENGYDNRLTPGLYSANAMALREKPGQAAFDNRESALGALSQRLQKVISIAENSMPRIQTHSAVPSLNEEGRPVGWRLVEHAEAAALIAEMTPEIQAIAKRRHAHDAAVVPMQLNIAKAELLRDFGVEVTIEPDSPGDPIAIQDMEIAHSSFGHLATVRDGEIFLVTEEGVEVRNRDYDFNLQKLKAG